MKNSLIWIGCRMPFLATCVFLSWNLTVGQPERMDYDAIMFLSSLVFMLSLFVDFLAYKFLDEFFRGFED